MHLRFKAKQLWAITNFLFYDSWVLGKAISLSRRYDASFQWSPNCNVGYAADRGYQLA